MGWGNESLFKKSSPEPKRPMTLKLGMQHWVLKHYQVSSNDDPGLALTILRNGRIWSLMLLYGKKVKQ